MVYAIMDEARNGHEGDATGVIDTTLYAGRTLIVFLLFTISPFALIALNWQYFDTGGSFVDKFHPATLIAFALVALPVIAARNPVSAAIAFANRNMDLIPFVLAIFFTLSYAAIVLGHSITIFLETFLGAVAMFILFDGIDERQRRVLARILHALLFINAVWAFYELVSGFRLTPLVVNGEVLLDEPRATSLLGHPLSNAMVAGAYVVILGLGGGKDIPAALRTPAFLVALASLVPFGGRAATATALLSLALIAAQDLVRFLRGGRVNTTRLLWKLVVIPICLAGLVAAHEMGWLDTLLDRLVDDEGSAGTRIVMFELFDHFTFSELFLGADPTVLMTWIRQYGLEYGIESFIVAFILHYGILTALIFFPCFFYFLYQIVEATGHRSTWWVIFYFLVVALASVSLSSKSPIFSIFVVMVLTLLRGDGARRTF